MVSRAEPKIAGRTPAARIKPWSPLGGERFYVVARWLTVLLLAAVTQFLTTGEIWPIAAEIQPLTIVLLLYAGFTLLTTIAVFLPGTAGLLSLSYLADIVFISLMTFFGGEKIVIFFPLYLLPLISAAIRQPPLMSALSGGVAAVFYMAAFLAWRRILVPDALMTLLDYVALGLRGLTLTIVPWVTSNLAERWSESNRHRVAEAQGQAEQALVEAQAYRDQMRSLYDVALTLGTTVDYRRVLDALLGESRKLISYRVGVVLLSSGRPDELYVAAGQPLAASDQGRQLRMDAAATAALRAQRPQQIAAVGQDACLSQIDSLRGCAAATLIPLRAALRTYGLFVVAGDRPLQSDQIEMLTALANYAIIALHNAQLIYDLKEDRAKLLSKEEEVRHQLARDLHDGPAQSLAAITMNIEYIKRILERDPAQVVSELDKLSALSKRTTYEVRTMLFELRPLVLESQGLKVTLEQYLERFRANSGSTAIVLECDGVDQVRLQTKAEGTLFNIIQEAINNALKHARAQHIWVRLRSVDQNLEAVVQDDGAGFDKAGVLKSYEKRGSFGLLNIDERARLVGGRADIDSVVGQGTTVTIIVPLEP